MKAFNRSRDMLFVIKSTLIEIECMLIANGLYFDMYMAGTSFIDQGGERCGTSSNSANKVVKCVNRTIV